MATGFSLLVWAGGRCDAVAGDENIIASMFGTTLTFRDVCCKSADKSLGLSRLRGFLLVVMCLVLPVTLGSTNLKFTHVTATRATGKLHLETLTFGNS